MNRAGTLTQPKASGPLSSARSPRRARAQAYVRPKAGTALVLDGNGAQAVELVRVLGALDWDVLCEPGTRSSRSRWTAQTVELPSPDAGVDGYVDRLRAICEQLDVSLVVPSNDLSLECCWRAATEQGTIAGARILGGDRRSTEVFLDKHEGIRAARRYGFGVPRTVAAESAEEVVAATAEIGYPCVVKPRRSFQRVGGVMCHLRHAIVTGRNEAERAVAALTGDDGLLPLAQELVDGRSLAVTAVVRDRVIIARCARETLSFYPLVGGTSVWKRTIPATTSGVRGALALLTGFGLEGLGEVEFKLSRRGPRFMEVGPRAHGWIPLAEASRPGFVAAAIRAAAGDDVEPLPGYRVRVQMRWIGGDVRRLRAILGNGGLPPTISRASVLKTVWPPWRPGMRYDGVDLADPGPWTAAPVAHALDAARRIGLVHDSAQRVS